MSLKLGRYLKLFPGFKLRRQAVPSTGEAEAIAETEVPATIKRRLGTTFCMRSGLSSRKIMTSEHRTVFLMYHELEEPRRTLCQSDPGYVRYVLSSAQFRAQMQLLRDKGWRGVSVSEGLTHSSDAIVITFDDGCETDLLCAAPILREFRFGATFYITTGFLGNPGYLSHAELQELCGLGFEIGCHSMTHAYLTDLDDAGLYREIAEAKTRLEDLIGLPVLHFSCPGGRHNYRVAEVAREAGYQTVATSRMRANSARTHRFSLGRVAVMRATSLETFTTLCSGQGLKRQDLMVQVRETARRLVGNSLYDRVRAALLQ
jgi:peptidoglycan/xylan/chitin deacetylase (PgdA/CDA1 family)